MAVAQAAARGGGSEATVPEAPAAGVTGIDRILQGVPLPAVAPVRQHFADSPLTDLPAALPAALAAGDRKSVV